MRLYTCKPSVLAGRGPDCTVLRPPYWQFMLKKLIHNDFSDAYLSVSVFVIVVVVFCLSYQLMDNFSRQFYSISVYNAPETREGQYIWPASAKDSMYRISLQLEFSKSFGRLSTNATDSRLKVILRAGTFNFYDWVDGQEVFVRNRCPVTQCLLTSDTDNYLQTADALIISEMHWWNRLQYRSKPGHQIWIAQHMEAPTPTGNRLNPRSVRQLINWTATYRRDSTIPKPYYFVRRKRHSLSTEDRCNQHRDGNFATGRKKKIAWVVSNCYDDNGRRSFAYELSKYVDVDIYGNCGKLSCEKAAGNVSCFEYLRKHYKFYLSFENSNCWDYITEKFFSNALLNDLLPIVMGARPADYADVAPPFSYIHIDAFRSPRDLAAYIHYLDNNDTAYNEYFRWKRDWEVTGDTGYWCRVCGLLHAADREPRYVHWYSDYVSWWNGVCTAKWTSSASSSEGKGGRWQTWRTLP